MGGPAAARPEARPEARPTVTLVTSDLKGSTALGERLDPEALREVLNRYFAAMRAVFESHGGRIEKIIGDAIVAVFGLPEPADDDAIRAVEAAAESMRALATLNDELEAGWGVRLVTRTGVASGEVTFGEDLEGQHVLLGETVEISGVMEQNAPPLEVLIAESTFELVRDAIEAEAVEPVSPKGSDDRLAAWRLVSVHERAHHELAEWAASEQVARDTRRTVTLVFAMAKVHPVAGTEPGPDVLRDVMSIYFAAMRTALEHHGGTVEKYIGDAVMAVFGLPVRHEDDAIRAVRAASDMQAALGPLNDRFRTEFGVELLGHIGVNTGEVIATGDASSAQRLVTGDTVNTAARLEQAAGAGEVILGELTHRLAGAEAEVEPIAPLSLKGKAEPVPAYRLLRAGHRSSTTSATPFVGRSAELARLGEALAEAIASRGARLVSVVGDAGVGKSRLIREFAEQASTRATVLRGRCLPYGNGITFWPLNEAIAGVAKIESDDSPAVAIDKIRALVGAAQGGASPADTAAIVDRVAAAINLTTAQFPVTELVWGTRRLLEILASGRPVVFIIDDLQSAEAAFLDLLDAVLDASADAPIVLLCSARRELAERHPDWSGAHVAETITLTPLSDAEAGAVVGELLGALDESVQARIAEVAEGNPLYLEQIVSMLIETRAIERDGERWVARSGTGGLAIPPTVQALVAARLDALASEERQVIEPASVIGLSFAEEALAELVEEPLKPLLDDELGSLAGKELIRPVQGAEVVFRFGHVVIRDTAYGGLLKRVRAALHERFVAWAERVNRERGRELEFEEILGYHLEQAFRYRTELGVVDARAREVGERAAEKLASAGRRAFGRGDATAAASLLRRAADVLQPESRTRIELLPELAEALIERGGFDAASAVAAEVAARAASMADSRLAARAMLVRYQLAFSVSGSVGDAETALGEIQVMMAEFERSRDLAGQARAWRLLSVIDGTAGRYDRAAESARHVVEVAEEVGDARLAARGAISYAYATLHGTTPVAESLRRCQEFVGHIRTDRQAEAIVLGVMAQLHAMEGEFARARELLRRSREMITQLGASVSAASTSLESSRVEMLAGEPAAAEQALRRDYEVLEQLGETYFRSTVAALLGQVLWAQGRPDEARAFARIAREIADEDDVLSQVGWRGVEAKSLAATDPSAAIRLATEGVALAAATVDIDLHADALLELDEVLRLAGHERERGPHLREALELYERKGDRVLAMDTRARIELLPTGTV